MIEEFTSRGSRDFRQRYEGTYGFYIHPETKRRMLVLISEVRDDALRFTDEKRMDYSPNADRGFEFEFIPLEKKLFNFGEQICCIRRIPARQFQRGVCRANTLITSLSVENTQVGLSFAAVAAAYADEKRNTPEMVAEYVAGKRKQLLVSPMFAFIGKKLYLYETPVAVVKDKTLLVEEPIFRQEVADMVEKHHFPYSVEI